ncbi:MAG TPA: neutral zinc metallopeptidase [Longimicrobiaceae bacterium]|nr:neutral zinc metallopeptidase [Longimicrobiaceae bacterium]
MRFGGGGRRSGNVTDRRGMGGGAMAGGGIGAVVIALIVMFMGGDPGAVLQQAPAEQAPPGSAPGAPPSDSLGLFVDKVLASTEDVWNQVFPAATGQQYREPELVLFSGATGTACGTGQSAMGPFYCPPDQSVYIDLSFYRDMKTKLGAPGDFAQAYVIAHEVGHHVQNQLGTSDEVHNAQQRLSKAEGNAMSVRLELQADCYAGLWGYHATRSGAVVLDPGDIDEALNAASAIGDDRLQQQSQGRVVPESFTHGTSEQRARWFRRGFETGDMRQCDTFKAPRL